MNDRLLSLLGLCRRAKKLVIGAEITVESVKNGRSKLVLYAVDFSKNSLKRVLEETQKHGVEVLEINRSKDQLSHALGRLCGVLSVEDKGFAVRLRGMINDEKGGEFYDKV